MINLLEETKAAIEKHGHRPEDIIFIGIPDSGESCSWAEFLALADKEYYEEVGEIKVHKDLIILFKDGSRLYRHDYDTIEEWRYMPAFHMPAEIRPLKSLWMCPEDRLQVGSWDLIKYGRERRISKD